MARTFSHYVILEHKYVLNNNRPEKLAIYVYGVKIACNKVFHANLIKEYNKITFYTNTQNLFRILEAVLGKFLDSIFFYPAVLTVKN